jgi:F0F1-type ATP synthase membrane subunit c/vacuolar-type H+-ATPase subunit K
MEKNVLLSLIACLIISVSIIIPPIYAETPRLAQEGLISDFVAKVFAAAVAFMAAVVSAAWGISRAGSAWAAASAERPEIRTVAIIISAFAEALGIYGIVIAFFILGAG